MIELTKVVTLNGVIINRGEWEYQLFQAEVINNPFPGPLQAPEDWDYQITYETLVGNPMPEGAVEEELEVFYDRQESLRRVNQAAELEIATRVAEAKAELTLLYPDVLFGLASDETVERARELRVFIKEHSNG